MSHHGGTASYKRHRFDFVIFLKRDQIVHDSAWPQMVQRASQVGGASHSTFSAFSRFFLQRLSYSLNLKR